MVRSVNYPAAGALVCAAVSAFCISCTSTPAQLPAAGVDAVAVAVNQSSAEQVVLGQIYTAIFESMGYAVSQVEVNEADASNAIELLQREPIDLAVACTGALLEEQDSTAAAALTTSGEQDEELSVATYDALLGTFPAAIRTVDPSPAQGCKDPSTSAQPGDAAGLPQNLIPIFVDGKFDRSTVNRLNFITRVMATDDIAEAAERVEQGEAVETAVAEWLIEYAGMTIDTAGDLKMAPDPQQPQA